MIRICGAVLGLFAFSVTILLGLAAGNPVDVTLLRGVWALLIFCAIGLGSGWVAARVIEEHAGERQRELSAKGPVEAQPPPATPDEAPPLAAGE